MRPYLKNTPIAKRTGNVVQLERERERERENDILKLWQEKHNA
jgi:hypothetical protein